MQCPKCHYNNPEGNKFCAECGTKLQMAPSTLVCPHCGHTIPADSKFCPDCGSKIAAQPMQRESVIVIETSRKVQIHYKPIKGSSLSEYFNSERLDYDAALEKYYKEQITIPKGRSVIQVCDYPDLALGFRLGKERDKVTMIDLSSFDTKNVTDMSCMFRDCSSLQSLDLSGFDTENVTDMSYMFEGCSSLYQIECDDTSIIRAFKDK